MTEDHRRKPRHRCSFEVFTYASNWKCVARVVDISEGGMCIETNRIMDIQAGDAIEIHSRELGCLAGQARWRRFDRIGVEFHLTTDTKAKLEAFQRHFFRETAV